MFGTIYDGPSIQDATRLADSANTLGLRWRFERLTDWRADLSRFIVQVEGAQDRPAVEVPKPPGLLKRALAPEPVLDGRYL